MTSTLSPTTRTTPTRGRNRMLADPAALFATLADGLVAHLGVVRSGEDGTFPVVLPVAYGVDPDGPDESGSLYVHGSVAAGWSDLAGVEVCVVVTLLDGLVAGRSAFHHSMNYRSAVVMGQARPVVDPAEKERALDLIVDHMLPGRSATLRPHHRRELVATSVFAVPLAESSVKARAGGPVDEPEDVAAGIWGGHVPLYLVAGEPVPDEDATGPVPADVLARSASL